MKRIWKRGLALALSLVLVLGVFAGVPGLVKHAHAEEVATEETLESVNLLTNGSFEQIAVQGWTGGLLTAKEVKTGTYALKLNAANKEAVSDAVAVDAAIYIATAMVKGSATVGLRYFDANGEVLAYEAKESDPAVADWQEVSVELAAPEGAATVSIVLGAKAAEGDVYFDDITLAKTSYVEPDSTNLVKNGTCESGDHWIGLKSGEDVTYEVVEAGGPDGSNCLKVTSNVENYIWPYHKVENLVPGQLYRLSADVKSHDGYPEGVYLRFIGGGNHDKVFALPATGEWTHCEFVFAMPEGITSGSVNIISTGKKLGSMSFDNVELIPITVEEAEIETVLNSTCEHANNWKNIWVEGTVSYEVVENGGPDGSNCLQITRTTNDYIWPNTDVTNLIPGKTYRFAADIKPLEGFPSSVILRFTYAGGNAQLVPTLTANEWNHVEFTFVMPEGITSGTVNVISGTKMTGSMAMDNVSLMAVVPTPEDVAVTNAGFETVDLYQINGWLPNQPEKKMTYLTSSEPTDGDWHIYMQYSGREIWSGYIPVAANQTLEWSMDAKVTAEGGAYIIAYYYAAEGDADAVSFKQCPTMGVVNEWASANGLITVPEGANYIRLRVLTRNGSNNTYIDNVSLTCVHEVEYVSNEDATCTEDGTKTGACKYCGLGHTITDVDTKGHTAGEVVIENVTGTTYDEVLYCTVCEEEFSRETKENKILNGDFEASHFYASNPLGWKGTNLQFTAEYVEKLFKSEGEGAYGGSGKSVLLNNAAMYVSSSSIYVIPGETYEASVMEYYHSTSYSTWRRVFIRFFDAEGNQIGDVIATDTTDTSLADQWVKRSVTADAPEGAVTAQMGFGINGTMSVLFDNASLVHVPIAHEWVDATCTTPKTCSICGKTRGEALGHAWADATCTAPKTCATCGETEGEALGHTAGDLVIENVNFETYDEVYYCTVCEEVASRETKANQILNGDFEASHFYATNPLGWRGTTLQFADYVEKLYKSEGEGAYGGSGKSVLLSNAGMYVNSSSIYVIPGETYEASIMEYYQSDSISTWRRVFIRFFDAEGNVIGEPIGVGAGYSDISQPDQWVKRSVTAVAPEGAVTAQMGFGINGTMNVKFDNAALGVLIHTHEWADATCTAPKTCTTCGETEGDALGHTAGAAADCENAQTCTVCGEVLVAALGHDWNDATCTAPKTCEVCGKTEGDALGHAWDGCTDTDCNNGCGETREAGAHVAGALVEGEAQKCVNCDYVFIDVVTYHDIIQDQINNAESGATIVVEKDFETSGLIFDNKTLTLDLNGKTITGTVGTDYPGVNAEYNYTILAINNANLTIIDSAEGGKVIKLDGIMGLTVTADVASTVTIKGGYFYAGHNGGEDDGYRGASTLFVRDGSTMYIEGGKFETAEAYDNVWFLFNVRENGAGESLREATFVVTGGEFVQVNPNAVYGNRDFVADGYCTSKSGNVYTVAESHIAGAAADCENAQTCTVCGEVLVAALGHKWDDATCDTPKTCSVCGKTEGDALGHTAGAAADCENAQICTVCGAELAEALGHDWADATCDTPKTCSVCGKTEGDALGHSYSEQVTKEPTCTEKGVKTFTCDCGDSYTEEIAEKGHTAGAAADCENAQTCTACGEVLVAALGHKWIAATTSAPKTCKVCGATEGEPLPPVTIPVAEVIDGKVVVTGTYESVRVIYIGKETFDVDGAWADLLAAGKRYPDVNTTGGYRTFNAPANPSLKTDGNYILRVIYTNDKGARVGVNYAATFKAPVPTISVDRNGNISTQGVYYKIRVVYTGEEIFDVTNNAWADLKAVGLNYTSVNGVNGYRNYRHNLKTTGNYVIRMVYVGLDGSLLSINYPVYFEAPTEAEAPTVSVDGTGNMTVTGVYSKIRVVYVGKTGFDVNNLDWNALKKAGLKYTDVNGAYGYRDYLVDLKKEGDYIVRFIYNDAEGNEITVNQKMTFTADVPGITVNADGTITVKDRYEAIRMVYIANEEFDLETTGFTTLKNLGLKYKTENTQNGYRNRLYTMKWEGKYIVRVIYYQPRHGNITVNYEVNFEA